MRYQDINHFLKTQSKLWQKGNLRDIERTLQLLVEKLNMNLLLDSILSDSIYLGKIVKLSYSHNLGFDKIILVPYERSNCQLRFNIWWDDKVLNSTQYEEIHNHRWDYSTFVLRGGYKYENYRVRKKGVPMYHYSYLPVNNGNFIYEIKEKKNIELFSSGDLRKNEIMSTRRDVLHRITPLSSESPTITLFLNTKAYVKKTSIYTKELMKIKESNVVIPPMTEEELKLKLIKLIDILR